MEFISLQEGLPLFEPKKRQAILLNTFDLLRTFLINSESHEGIRRYKIGIEQLPYNTTYLTRTGNCRVYQLEALLAGEFSNNGEKWNGFDAKLRSVFRFEIQKHKERGITYDSVIRVLPKKEGNKKEFDSKLEVLTKNSYEDTLTLLYITGHGNDKNFVTGVNDKGISRMSHDTLIKKLDKIKGKKVVLMLTCGSGYMFNSLEKSKSKEDYLVVTSTNKQEKFAISKGDPMIHNAIYFNIMEKGRISNIYLPSMLEEFNHPQISGSYDVIL